jgi:hypothetical protein
MAKALSLTLNPSLLHLFYPFLQQGVIIKTQVGLSIKDLLSQILGLNPEYVESRIQTVFLDGKAVDDLDSAVILNGSTLALSGALPGLVGATLRRQGPYASLRQAITLSSEEKPIPYKEGAITLKLFNLLVPQLGPSLLTRGVGVIGKDLDQLFKEPGETFWSGLQEAEVDGRQIELSALKKINWSKYKKPVLLKLKAASPE